AGAVRKRGATYRTGLALQRKRAGAAMTRLGSFVRAERKRRRLTLGPVARLVGYQNINKGARRIASLEQTGGAMPDLLLSVGKALGLDLMPVERLAEEDRQERLRAWEAWVSEPVPMHLVVRLMAAIYSRREYRTRTFGSWERSLELDARLVAVGKE